LTFSLLLSVGIQCRAMKGWKVTHDALWMNCMHTWRIMFLLAQLATNWSHKKD
jgi:hypothetical protein